MKNRKTVVIAFMLIAAMLLGVGYAALTDNFSITGNAEVGITQSNIEFDEKIYFSSATPTNTTGTSGISDTASVSTTDPDGATFSIKSLALSNEEATFTFTIKNESEFDATIAITQEPTQNTGYFETDVVFANGHVIKAGEELSFTVTTRLIKNVTSAVTASTTIKLSATTND